MEVDVKKLSKNMAACVDAFLISYAKMLAAKREALGESKEKFLGGLKALKTSEFVEALAKGIEERISAEIAQGNLGIKTIGFDLLRRQGGYDSDQFSSFIKATMKNFNMDESAFDFEAFPGVDVKSLLEIYYNKNDEKCVGIMLKIENSGKRYENISTGEYIFEFTDTHIRENKETGKLAGRILYDGKEEIFELGELMDHVVGKACEYNCEYVSQDIPRQIWYHKKAEQAYIESAEGYKKQAKEYQAKGQEVPYYIVEAINNAEDEVKYHGIKAQRCEEHLKNIYDPVDVNYKNGVFVAKLKNGSQPGEN